MGIPSDSISLGKTIAGLVVDTIRDVSEGARRSLSERSAQLTRAVAWVPLFLRRRVGETAALEGSESNRRWQAGEQCLAMPYSAGTLWTAELPQANSLEEDHAYGETTRMQEFRVTRCCA